MLRWGHFVLFALATIEYILERPSTIKEAQNDEDDKKLALFKVINRDGTLKLTSRILSSISVFIYQGTVFYAQMVLISTLMVQDASG